MDTEPAVSYHAAVPGTPVLTTTGNEIGTLEHVLAVPDGGPFDGLVIATDWGLRFVQAEQVEQAAQFAVPADQPLTRYPQHMAIIPAGTGKGGQGARLLLPATQVDVPVTG